MLKKWDDLPDFMRIPEVRPYWESLNKKRVHLFLKRVLDFVVATILLFILFLPMLIIAICIKLDSDGPVFYRQERVTKYGNHFRIHKFRTMISDADRMGTSVTVNNDYRITRIGAKLRRFRFDEFPQLIDVLSGKMSFVGTRPEVVKYVNRYIAEYNATFLMPAGITSEASIRYKDEDALLTNAENVDDVYVEQVLHEKMKWNLKSIVDFTVFKDILTLFRTILAVFGKDYR